MKYYIYLRVSTVGQTDDRQRPDIEAWLNNNGVKEYGEVSEKKSGAGKKNVLLYELLDRMEEGDCLVVSAVDRLARSIGDLALLFHEKIKPKKLRLVVVGMSMDIDFSQEVSPITEFTIQALSFAASLERSLILKRTEDGRKLQIKELKENGFYISKRSGEKRTQWGGHFEGKAVNTKVASRANHKAKQTWHVNSKAAKYVRNVAYGKGADEILMDLLEYVESDAEYSSRGKGEWNLAKVRRLQKVMLQWDVEIRMQYNIPYGKPIPVAVKYDLDCLDRAMRKYK